MESRYWMGSRPLRQRRLDDSVQGSIQIAARPPVAHRRDPCNMDVTAGMVVSIILYILSMCILLHFVRGRGGEKGKRRTVGCVRHGGVLDRPARRDRFPCCGCEDKSRCNFCEPDIVETMALPEDLSNDNPPAVWRAVICLE